LLQDGAILRNAVRMPSTETPSICNGAQRGENTRKNSFLNYESPALTAELQALNHNYEQRMIFCIQIRLDLCKSFAVKHAEVKEVLLLQYLLSNIARGSLKARDSRNRKIPASGFEMVGITQCF
jgi:hypothetical protein